MKAEGCEEGVIDKIRLRREAGRKKYGVTMERTDLTRLDWLRHAQEEAMDLAIYLERLIRDEEAALPGCGVKYFVDCRLPAGSIVKGTIAWPSAEARTRAAELRREHPDWIIELNPMEGTP